MTQYRVHVVWSDADPTGTITAEVWEGGKRVAAFVDPPHHQSNDLVAAAKLVAEGTFPTLF